MKHVVTKPCQTSSSLLAWATLTRMTLRLIQDLSDNINPVKQHVAPFTDPIV